MQFGNRQILVIQEESIASICTPILMTEVVGSFETLVPIYQITLLVSPRCLNYSV